jgi:antitoxin component YwqK of YwqJK toxin-antitoxin module
MKRFLAPILLLTLLFPSLAMGGEVKFDDLVYRDGIFYKKFSTVPFTGKVTGNYQGSIRNGEKHGPWVGFHDNEQLYYKGTFKDGKEDGPWVGFHDNGQLYYKGTYKNDKEDGPWVGFHDNGQLRIKGTYKDGKKDGPWFAYHKDGTVWDIFTGTYKNGVKVK